MKTDRSRRTLDISPELVGDLRAHRDRQRLERHARGDAWQDWGKISSGYNSPPLNDMWKKPMPGLDADPKLTIMQDWRDLAFVYGYQGPISSAMEEVQSTFVIPNMFARAARGDTPENAVAWAESEYKRIFSKYNL